jgi:hypothetical protein
VPNGFDLGDFLVFTRLVEALGRAHMRQFYLARFFSRSGSSMKENDSHRRDPKIREIQ